MVSKKLLKEYDFNYIEDYYDYIIETYINGQPKQVEKLFLAIKKSQRELFISYLLDDKNNCKDWEHILKIVTSASFNEWRKK